MMQQLGNDVHLTTIENLPIYRAQAFEQHPNLVHAIFTRQGGVSQPPYNSLNLGSMVGDDPVAVTQNFHRLCEQIHVTPEQVVSCHLIHGAKVLTVTKSNRQSFMGKADGMITKEMDTYLFMRFGDCTPLLFFDPVQQAVGLTHAGWRGTMANVSGATIEAMTSHLGCHPENIISVIGPAIGACCYEVGGEVMAQAKQSLTDSETLFSAYNDTLTHAHFDMIAANRHQLVEAGVKQIIQSDLCTAFQTDHFFSHRAEKGKTGRFGVMIGIRGNQA
ncbi:MAG: peptidoglycan editing factor PgeF [Chloroflexota bacterium]